MAPNSVTARPGRAHSLGASVPDAQRARRPGWRDPRILVGIAVVAGSVLLGAQVMATADDTIEVWSVRGDLPAGSLLDRSALELQRVHFASEGASDHYFTVADPPAETATLDRPVAAGELLPRSAVRTTSGPELVEVPLSLAPDDLPATVQEGSVVDVWVTARSGARTTDRARLVLDDVVVVDLPRRSGSLAPQGTRQVIVGVGTDAVEDVAETLGRSSDGRVVLTRQSGQ